MSGIWSGYWVLDPVGPVANADFKVLVVDVILLMVIIGPTTALLTWCMWRYRRASRARFEPNWSHSLLIEVFSWGLPFTVVILLAFVSIEGVFAVNPFGPTALADSASGAEKAPLDVDVVTTDWQWLFIYPGRHVAVSNRLVVPMGTPVHLLMTSATVTNDVFIPQVVGQIDIMPGMLTQQQFVIPREGSFQGFSTNYSGPGFSWMRFKTDAVTPAAFQAFIADAEKSPDRLTYAAFDTFAKPTINQAGAQRVFSDVPADLLTHVIHEVDEGKTWPTPAAMTEKMSAPDLGFRKQPTTGRAVHTTPAP